ncbi:6-bladed beta-propeller [Ramlibacter sp. RBP-2]|uniref:6-bladed beta-propeller n=2 Tax=Ramlibacter lithotrophicus TaxID=2606681 RepID=A0A7X6DGV4_9BURK|nr:6-bladed beta-propeller [Ramlibacter lithotrophicus]
MKPGFSKARLACAVVGMAAALFAAGCAQAPQVQAAKPFVTPVFPPAPEPARIVWERSLHTSADVVPDDSDGALRRLVTGELRTGEGFNKPYGVAARNGRVYVGDTVARHVALFDLNARTYTRIGVDEPGALRMPFGMDLDDRGNLYVVDGTLKLIHVYDGKGKFLRKLGQDIGWSRPVGLAIDSARKRLYVVDVGGVDSAEHRVRVLDLESGKLLFDIGKRGNGPGELNLPRDAAVGGDGLLYVVDGGNFRIQVYDPDGKFIKTFGGIGIQLGQFSRPKEIASDAAGNLYVVDTGFGNFQIFDREGTLLLDVGARGDMDAPAKFSLPSGIAVDVDGRIYMVDQFFRKVEVFRPASLPAGSPYGQAASAGARPPLAATGQTPAAAPAR